MALAAMSTRVDRNRTFLQLLLTTHLSQQKALLDTASPQQIDLISELLYNILYVVPLSEKERKSLQRKRFLKDVSKIKRSANFRRKKVRARKAELLKLLHQYSKNILSLL